MPGTIADSVLITDGYREVEGDRVAFNRAVQIIRREYLKLCEGWATGKGVEFNLVLTINRSVFKE